jgi:nucleoside-diphosphate-sugar epimerase
MMGVNLVLGSSGLVGRSLCKYLGKIGETVIEYDIKRDKNEDLRKAKLDLDGVDRVYFLAWDVGGAKYLYRENTQEHQLKWNLDILRNTMPQLKVSGIPFLFISTQLHNAYTAYGIGKTLGEYWTRLYSNGRVIRLWNIYGGVEEPGERSHVIADIIQDALDKNEINLLTDGSEKRYFIFEKDACRGFISAIGSPQTKSIYDIAGPKPVSIMEAALIISHLTNSRIYIKDNKHSFEQFDIPTYLPGFFPEVKIEEGIKIMLDRYKNCGKIKA